MKPHLKPKLCGTCGQALTTCCGSRFCPGCTTELQCAMCGKSYGLLSPDEAVARMALNMNWRGPGVLARWMRLPLRQIQRVLRRLGIHPRGSSRGAGAAILAAMHNRRRRKKRG